jgi:hypothetical protein
MALTIVAVINKLINVIIGVCAKQNLIVPLLGVQVSFDIRGSRLRPREI